MVLQHDQELFGSCTQHGECEASCPKQISINFIARMNADFIKTAVTANAPLKQREGQ
jgi:succinate dehydrogenase / fumarate reductase iron-sulfur subunit